MFCLFTTLCACLLLTANACSNVYPHPQSTGIFDIFLRDFALFIPSAMGVAGGLNMAANLSEPQRAIPVGTLGASAVSGFITFLLGT